MNQRHALSYLLAAGLMAASLMPARSSAAAAQDAALRTPVQISAQAAAAHAQDTAADLSEERLAELLTQVKRKIEIPKEYTVFDSNYSAKSSYSNEMWEFYWRTEDGSRRIRITCDKSANIISYYQDNYSDSDRNTPPAYLKEELKEKADAFIKQAANNIADKVAYISSNYNGFYQNQYTYVYTRIENGIPVPQQQVRVAVNAMTGTVESFEDYALAHEVKIPEKKILITKKQAEALLKDRLTMQLKYKDCYSYDKSGEYTKKVLLVYEPSTPYLSVDAASGAIYDSWEYYTDGVDTQAQAEDESMESGAAASGRALTDAELSKIAELADLLPKEEAAALVKNNPLLHTDAKATVLTASLSNGSLYSQKGQANDARYCWNIRFTRPDQESLNFYTTEFAVVDAKTGEILSFRTYIKGYYDYLYAGETIPAVRYTKEESRKIFEKFSKSQNGERFGQTVFSSAAEQNLLNITDEKEIFGEYAYTYNRSYDNIEYDGNSIYGSVDGVTGRITSYGFNWDDAVEFEKAENIITPAKAYDAFIQYEGFDLVYELNTIPDTSKQEARLVYQMRITPPYVSPFTGKQLDYTGSVYVKPAAHAAYTDIAGHPYERSIRLLADIGTSTGGKFRPNDPISLLELQQLTETALYVNSAYALKGYAKATRQAAAEYAVNLLGLEEIAKLPGIYKVDAADAAQIKESHIGSIALAKAFGILSLDSEQNFRPDALMTRAEAADMIVKLFQYNSYIY